MPSDLIDHKLLEDTRLLSSRWSLPNPDLIRAPLAGGPPALRLRFEPNAELYLLPNRYYPELPPHAVMNWGDGSDGTFLALGWNPRLPENERLGGALRFYIEPPGPYRTVWGPEVGVALTTDPTSAQLAGWMRFLSGKPVVSGTGESARERVDSRVVDALVASNVLVIGLGSVGSYMSEQLVRTGLGGITLIDPDRVEAANLSRTVYSLRDIGISKAAALARKLLEINPALSIEQNGKDFANIGEENLREYFGKASLILSVTDDHRVQSLVNRCAFFTQRPAVYVGLYRGAKGGEVISTVPTMTPCFNCIAASRPRAVDASGQSQEREADYGTSRLTDEIALGCDIQHVASVGVKIVISLLTLMCGAGEADCSKLMLRALRAGVSMSILSCEPDYWPALFEPVFQTTPGQLAFQSIWIAAHSSDTCAVCGRAANREDPFPFVRPDPRVHDVRLLRASDSA
jgi:molybdopterin/thiamine biosynthesis adenylyltransferase